MKDSLPENAKNRNNDKKPRRSGDLKEQGSAPRPQRKLMSDRFPDIHGNSAPKGAPGALIELDKELMKLLVRRATLVSRIRGGKDHASTPQAILEEKSVRTAWETNALSFSKDPKFSRQLFSLLQDLKVLSKEDSEGSSYFALAPSRAPVDITITGPSQTTQAQMWTALTASLGKRMKLEPVLLADDLVDLVKAYAQGGALLSWKPCGALGTIESTCDAPASFTGKNVYVGDSELSLYLIAFTTAASVGVTSLTGGTTLKNADLSALRTTLPLLGARFATKIPRSTGLPANIESAGMIPQHITVPAELPYRGVCALLLAAAIWNTPITLDLSALPAAIASAALLAVQPLARQLGLNAETHGATLVYSPSSLSVPAEPIVDIDPSLAGYLLALPAFSGGQSTLHGCWNTYNAKSQDVQNLLDWAGLQLTVSPESIKATTGKSPFSLPLHEFDLDGPLAPLYYALAARAVYLTKAPLTLPFMPAGNNFYLVQDFYSRLGLIIDNGVLSKPRAEGPADDTSKSTGTLPWTSPDAYWTMAFSLAALLRPGLRLANPGSITGVMPCYWGIYNSLPTPKDPAKTQHVPQKDQNNAASTRRRIITE